MNSLGVPIGTQHLFAPTSLHLVKTSTLVACVVPGLHNIIFQFIFPDGYHFDAQYPNGQSETFTSTKPSRLLSDWSPGTRTKTSTSIIQQSGLSASIYHATDAPLLIISLRLRQNRALCPAQMPSRQQSPGPDRGEPLP
jgi:hypothetical protein